jgi:hypothetical protein
MSEHKCCARVWSSGGYHHHSCGRTAGYEHEGKRYCKTHHPPTVKAKNEERDRKWLEKYSYKRAVEEEAAKARAEQERRAECYSDLLEALKACADIVEKRMEHTHELIAHMKACKAIAKAEGQS